MSIHGSTLSKASRLTFPAVSRSTLIPAFVLILFLMCLVKKVNGYEAFLEGIKEALSMSPSIFPGMMAMILMVNLLKESRMFELLTPVVSLIVDLPSELIAMCFFRPVSGGASMAMMNSILQTYGPDSLYGIMASVIQGSTDTTIYVIALYFSSVGIKKIRNAMWIGLFADLAGIAAAIFLTVQFF